MTHIIAISNQKGGVAKTTTTFSLGACLVELGYRVLVVDLDSQSNLTMAAGIDADTLTHSIADLLNAQMAPSADPLPEVIQPTRMAGMDILPSDLHLAGAEHALYDFPGYEWTLSAVLSTLQEKYDYILLDCPPSLGAITLMALTAAQMVLVPVQCEYYAARGLNRLLDIVAAVQEHTNPPLTYRLLATLYDQRNSICQTVLGQLQTHFAGAILQSVIGIDTRLRESPIAGEPIILYAPKTRASEQYRQLAREFDAVVTQDSKER